MRRLLSLLVLLAGSAGAQTIFLQPDTTTMGSPQTLTVWDGTYKQFTAYVQGTNDKGVTISTTGGTLDVTSCTISPCRFTLTSATNGTFTVTVAAHANASVTASQAIQFSGSPTKVACSAAAPDTSVCHPRFLFNPSMVAALQAKATGGNPMYQALLANAICNFQGTGSGCSAPTGGDNAIWSWSCAPGTGTGCAGGTGLPSSDQTGSLPEAHARIYAQMAVLDPSDPTYNWKAYGRDIWTYAERATLRGQMDFWHSNQWSQQVDDWAPTQDLLESTGYLSSADMTLYRNFDAVMLLQLGPQNSYGGGPPTVTNLNNVAQFTSGAGQRAMGNNYTQSKLLLTVSGALTLDDNTTDDPLIPTGALLSATPATGGSSWAVGDTASLPGGAVIKAAAVSGGVVTLLDVVTPATGYDNTGTILTATAIGPSTGTGLTVNVIAGNTCGAARGAMCPDYTSGDMHAQWNFFTGGWLLKWWGHADDPTAVLNAENAFYPSGGFGTVPTLSWPITGQTYPALGDGVGGETVEGGYWWHVYTVIEAMAFMNSAGWDDPLLYGPQISMEYSSFWDEEMMAQQSAWAFFGPNWNPAEPGYSLRATGGDTEIAGFTTNPSYQLWANYMAILDGLEGRTDRSNAELWTTLDSAYGGPLGTSGGCTSHCGWVNSLTNGIAFGVPWPAFIALPASDPTASLPTDPRTVYPTVLWNDSFNNHQSVRNCWATTCARVEFYGTNGLVDHEHNTQGSFEVIQNNEHITKPRNEFDDNYNNIMSRPAYINTASYFDVTATQPFSSACTADNSLYAGFFGGQWEAGAQKGFINPLHSEMPNYAADHTDDTLAYDGCNFSGAWNYNDVSAASRDFLWIRGSNQIAVYDRGTTGTAAYKATSLIATGPVTLSTNTATWLTQSGTQKARVSALLPSGVNPTSVKVLNYVVVGAPHSTLQSGTTMQATCTGFYNDGTSADLTSDPNTLWFTDNSPIAISSSGLVSTVGGIGTGADIQCINNGVKNQGANNGLYSIGFVTVGSSSSGTFSGSVKNSQYPDWEPEAVVQLSVASSTASQFLYTLEWGANTFTPTTATLVQSSAGQGYDCAELGTTLGCFMRVLGTFTGTTYAASGATTQYVSDLTPNTIYTITGAGTPSTVTSDNAGVLTFAATGTGNITVGASIPPAIAAISGGILSGAVIQ